MEGSIVECHTVLSAKQLSRGAGLQPAGFCSVIYEILRKISIFLNLTT